MNCAVKNLKWHNKNKVKVLSKIEGKPNQTKRLKVECIGHYLQSLGIYVENNKFDADFSEYRNKIEKIGIMCGHPSK